MHIHVLGICGTLMGSIALLARQQGHTVTGSDQNVYPPMSVQLQQAGISLQAPYSATSIPDKTDLVIIGNANLARGKPCWKVALLIAPGLNPWAVMYLATNGLSL